MSAQNLKCRFTKEIEVVQLAFCFSSLKRFELFVTVEDYEKYGNNSSIRQKLGKTESNVLGALLPQKSYNTDTLVYKVSFLSSDV